MTKRDVNIFDKIGTLIRGFKGYSNRSEMRSSDTLLRNEVAGIIQQTEHIVIEIQKELINKGYYIGKFGDSKDGIDGIYGPITKAAHESYKKGIPPEEFESELESTTSEKELEKI